MESDGLLFAGRLAQGGVERLDWAGVRGWRSGEGLLWVHLQYDIEAAARWLYEESGIDEMVADALTAEATRPRVIAHDGGLLAVLRGVNTNPGADPEDMVSLRIWLQPGRVITTRQRRLLSVEGLRQALEAGEGPDDPAAFLAELVERLTERIGLVSEAIDERLVALEEQALDEGRPDPHGEVTEMRRQLIRLRRFLAPQRDALSRLQQERVAILDDDSRLRLRESGNLLTRYVEDLDAAHERAVVTHEEIVARQSELLNRRMYALSLVAGIFLPLGFATGLLGINVGGMPGAESPWGFWVVCGLLGLAAVGQLWLFKRMRWL
ncbi:zinc transporter ZntB [Endothiovibrio diazotrophicus]